jgi:ubiquinone/menaquinone biosynthesis C-methylase UbiE
MNSRAYAKRFLPGFGSRLLVRRVVNFPRDVFESVTGRRDPLIPPHGLWFVGGEEDYQAVNEEYMGYFVNFAGLQPFYRVLDVGCGIGVMAARLTKFLDSDGSYSGFDIVQLGVNWAQKHIGSRFPNFSFVHADIYNKHYNPKGKLSPGSFRFPYEDASFDFVFLKSVFTHLLPDSVPHYLREARRVLKPTGCCLATVFLLNDESTKLMREGRSSISLVHELDGCRVVDPKFPESTVGIPDSLFQKWCKEAAMTIRSPIRYGSWCGRKEHVSYQDILILAPSA